MTMTAAPTTAAAPASPTIAQLVPRDLGWRRGAPAGGRPVATRFAARCADGSRAGPSIGGPVGSGPAVASSIRRRQPQATVPPDAEELPADDVGP